MIRGRKRKPGKRYACGKRTRHETERDAISVAIDARRRHFGVTAKQAKDERLGTALGRLAFRELISELAPFSLDTYLSMEEGIWISLK